MSLDGDRRRPASLSSATASADAHAAPAGYREAYALRLSASSRAMVGLNLGAIALLVPAIALFVWPAVARGFIAQDLVFTLTITLVDGLILIGATVGVVLAHEAVHGLVMRAFGARPRYGIKWELLAAYATAAGHLFRRDQFLLIALAPLLTLTPLLWLAAWWTPAGAVWMALALAGILNTVGAVGDLFMSWKALAHPRTALVLDEEDGMRVYVKASGDALQGSDAPSGPV